MRVRLSRASALAMAVALGAVPFLLPEDAYLWRAVCTGYAIALAMKLRQLVDGAEADADPAMLASPPRLVLWLLIPQDTWWPRSPAEASAVRRTAPGLLGRATLELVSMMAIVELKGRLGAGAPLPARTALEMLEFYLLLAALADAVAGLAALAGVHCEPAFRDPILAHSPAEFWSRRWNLVIHRFARRHVFLPAARRWGPAAALLVTFAGSGLMHEYLVLAAVGPRQYRPGFMLAFFLLHGVAVLVTTARRGGRPPTSFDAGTARPRSRVAIPDPAAVLAHLVWLVATAPLFFHPLRPQINAFDAACSALITRVVP